MSKYIICFNKNKISQLMKVKPEELSYLEKLEFIRDMEYQLKREIIDDIIKLMTENDCHSIDNVSNWLEYVGYENGIFPQFLICTQDGTYKVPTVIDSIDIVTDELFITVSDEYEDQYCINTIEDSTNTLSGNTVEDIINLKKIIETLLNAKKKGDIKDFEIFDKD